MTIRLVRWNANGFAWALRFGNAFVLILRWRRLWMAVQFGQKFLLNFGPFIARNEFSGETATRLKWREKLYAGKPYINYLDQHMPFEGVTW